MATLRFRARHDHKVWYPGLKIPNGQAPIYLGRKFVPGADGKPSTSPATEDPIECETGDQVANRIHRLMIVDAIDPPFFCADSETAAACGLPYVQSVFRDGVWIEATDPPPVTAPDSERSVNEADPDLRLSE